MQEGHKLTGAFEPRTFKLTARKSAFILCQTRLPVYVSNLHKSLNIFFLNNSRPSHSLPSTHTSHNMHIQSIHASVHVIMHQTPFIFAQRIVVRKDYFLHRASDPLLNFTSVTHVGVWPWRSFNVIFLYVSLWPLYVWSADVRSLQTLCTILEKIQQILDSLADRLAALLFSRVYLTVTMFCS